MNGRYLHSWLIAALVMLLMFLDGGGLQTVQAGDSGRCRPTQPDTLGPFYVPNAPVRSKIGEGYVLTGVVQSSSDCRPLPGAVIEFWMAGPDGNYGDEYRAAVITDQNGRYRFESHSPVSYYRRPPHIHMRVVAAGHRVLVTQHYSEKGWAEAAFDLVLQPES